MEVWGEGEVWDDERRRLLAGLGADDEAPDSAGFKSAGSTGKHKCPWPGLELLCKEKHEEAMALREKRRKRRGAGRKEAVRARGRWSPLASTTREKPIHRILPAARFKIRRCCYVAVALAFKTRC